MSAPNIVGVTTIIGKTTAADLTTSVITLVSNPTSSSKVLKINSIIVANIDGTNNADVSIDLNRGGTAYYLAKTVVVPADASMVIISKDNGIYLEENDILRGLASANGDLQVICSYEEIS